MTLQATLSSASSVSSYATPGTLLAGKYRVERVLGQGGMAVVVAAKHLQLRETVAVKLLHPHVLANPRSIERFLREARVTMRLRGEHIARVYDVGALDDRTPFVVMESLDGADLGALLRERGRLPVREAVDYVLQACEAVAEAHAAGVVHRDLKPANLFLTARIDGSPCVKVLDFGISKTLVEGPTDDAPDSEAQLPRPIGAYEPFDETAPPSLPAEVAIARTLESGEGPRTPRPEVGDYGLSSRAAITMTHAFLGSPKYAAPEQLRCARDVDARVDVWALGVILHELVNGAAPFQGDNLEEISDAILNRPPAPLLTRPPVGLEAILARCLAKDRADRFPGVSALAEALEPLASEEGRLSAERVARMASGRRASEPPAPARLRDRPRHHGLARALTVLAWVAPAIALGALTTAFVVKGPSADRGRIRSEPTGASAPQTAAGPEAAPAAPQTVLVPLPAPSANPSAGPVHMPDARPPAHNAASRPGSAADPLGVPGGRLFDTRR